MDPRRQRLVLVVAAVVFLVAAIAAWRALPPLDGDVRPWALILVPLVGTPLTIVANALEYAVLGRMLSLTVRRGDALRVSILATAANLLPVPGAVLVRVRALRRLGAGLRETLSATALVGVAWIAVAVVVAGTALVARRPVAGALVLAAGVGALGLFAALTGRGQPRTVRVRWWAEVAAVELLAVTAGSLRLYLALLGIGFDVDVVDAVALNASAVVASATGIFPGGLGVRELLAAMVSPLVGLHPSVGLLATAVDRVLGMTAHGLAALSLSTKPFQIGPLPDLAEGAETRPGE